MMVCVGRKGEGRIKHFETPSRPPMMPGTKKESVQVPRVLALDGRRSDGEALAIRKLLDAAMRLDAAGKLVDIPVSCPAVATLAHHGEHHLEAKIPPARNLNPCSSRISIGLRSPQARTPSGRRIARLDVAARTADVPPLRTSCIHRLVPKTERGQELVFNVTLPTSMFSWRTRSTDPSRSPRRLPRDSWRTQRECSRRSC